MVNGVFSLANFVIWSVTVGEKEDIFGKIIEHGSVSFIAADVVERIGGVLFFTLVTVFTTVVLQGNLETFYPERKRMVLVSSIVLGIIGLCTAGYAVAMSVVVQITGEVFVFDASRIVISTVTCFIFALLVATFGITLHNVRSNGHYQAMQRNVVLFLSGCTLFLVLFLAVCLLSYLYTFVSLGTYGHSFFFLLYSSEALFLIGLCLYVFAGVYVKNTSLKPNGYVPLNESDHVKENNVDIPTRYEL